MNRESEASRKKREKNFAGIGKDCDVTGIMRCECSRSSNRHHETIENITEYIRNQRPTLDFRTHGYSISRGFLLWIEIKHSSSHSSNPLIRIDGAQNLSRFPA